MINDIGARAREGTRYAPGDRVGGLIEGSSCTTKRMHITHYRDYLGCGLWYYDGSELPVLQLLWLDKSGHFPWEPGYSYGPDAQPDLTRTKRDG